MAQSVDQVCMPHAPWGAVLGGGRRATCGASGRARSARLRVPRQQCDWPTSGGSGGAPGCFALPKHFLFFKKNKNEMKGRNLLLTKGSSPAGSPARHFAPPPAVVNPRRTRLRPR